MSENQFIKGLNLTKYPTKGMFIVITKWTSHKDNSYLDDVLEVLSSDESLVLVNKVAKEGSFMADHKFTLNSSQFLFRVASDEFVRDLKDSFIDTVTGEIV